MATLEHSETALPKSRRIGPGALALIAVLAMFLLLAGALLAGSLLSARQVAAEIARVRAAGEPTTPADLDAMYALASNDQDTTELWLSALAVIDSPAYANDARIMPGVGEGGSIPLPSQPWPELDAADAFLAKYREPLDKMHQAAELGGAAHYPIKFADGIAVLLPHVQQMRAGWRLLALESDVRAHRNDPQAVARSLETMLAAADSLEREPFIVSQLVRIALNGGVCAQIERLLPALEFSDDDLVMLDRRLAAIDYDAALQRSLLGERAVGFSTFGNPATLGADVPIALAWSPLRNADQAAYLMLMEKYITASRASQIPLRDAMAQADLQVNDFLRSPSARWRYPITRLVTPGLTGFFNALNRAKAQQNNARAAIAIQRYRRAHGELPETRERLVPDFLERVPEDPFDGAPLRYLRADSASKIYSIGQDLIDQQGEAEQMLDIVFELKPATGRGAAWPHSTRE